MTDILSIDYSLLSSELTKEEIELLQQYQSLAANINAIKLKLEHINSQISNVEPENVESLTQEAITLQKSISILSTAFKSTVHNVLLHVDSNQLIDGSSSNDINNLKDQNNDYSQQNDANNNNLDDGNNDNDHDHEIKSANDISNTAQNQDNNQENEVVKNSDKELLKESESNADNDEDDDDVDLDSGIDEETMNAVDRIQHELAMSADIHRQIADQLEINNPEDY